MRIFGCIVCLLMVVTLAGCNKGDEPRVKTEEQAIVKKPSVTSSTFEISGDIATLTIN